MADMVRLVMVCTSSGTAGIEVSELHHFLIWGLSYHYTGGGAWKIRRVKLLHVMSSEYTSVPHLG